MWGRTGKRYGSSSSYFLVCFLLQDSLGPSFIRQTQDFSGGLKELTVLLVPHTSLCRWERNRMRCDEGGGRSSTQEMGRNKVEQCNNRKQMLKMLGTDVEIYGGWGKWRTQRAFWVWLAINLIPSRLAIQIQGGSLLCTMATLKKPSNRKCFQATSDGAMCVLPVWVLRRHLWVSSMGQTCLTVWEL